MALFDYKCDNKKCKFTEEYNTSFSVPKGLRPPEDLKCPKCKKGKLEKLFNTTRIGIDFVGPGFYINDQGKHAWKKNLTKGEQAKVLTGERDPY